MCVGGGSAPSFCVSPFAISWQEVAVGWELGVRAGELLLHLVWRAQKLGC